MYMRQLWLDGLNCKFPILTIQVPIMVYGSLEKRGAIRTLVGSQLTQLIRSTVPGQKTASR